MRILALDQGTRFTGWALSGDPMTFGLVKTPYKLTGNDAIGYQVKAAQHMIDQFHPDALALEETHVDPRHVMTVIILSRYRGRLEQVAVDKGLEVIDVSSHEVQDWVGLGAYAKHTVKKTRARFWATCEVHGELFTMNNPDQWIEENTADAICILRIAEHKVKTEHLTNITEPGYNGVSEQSAP